MKIFIFFSLWSKKKIYRCQINWLHSHHIHSIRFNYDQYNIMAWSKSKRRGKRWNQNNSAFILYSSIYLIYIQMNEWINKWIRQAINKRNKAKKTIQEYKIKTTSKKRGLLFCPTSRCVWLFCIASFLFCFWLIILSIQILFGVTR